MSPDAAFVAAVRNHPSVDPPNQSVWLQREGLGWVRLARLGEDTHWSNAIVWSEDSTRVAFLVQEASAMVFEAPTARLLSTIQLVAEDGYPTTRSVRELQFSKDGASLDATVCSRNDNSLCERASMPAVPAAQSGG